jgi:hypothetical protein
MLRATITLTTPFAIVVIILVLIVVIICCEHNRRCLQSAIGLRDQMIGDCRRQRLKRFMASVSTGQQWRDGKTQLQRQHPTSPSGRWVGAFDSKTKLGEHRANTGETSQR